MSDFPRELKHDSGHPMLLDDTRLMLSFKKALSAEEVLAVLRATGLVLEDAYDRKIDAPHQASDNINHTALRLWVRSPDGKPIDQARIDAIREQLAKILNLIEPVYRLVSLEGRVGLLCPFSNVLLIKPRRGAVEGNDPLGAIAERYGLTEWVDKSKYLGGHRYFLIKDPDKLNAYQLRSVLLEREKEIVAEAVFENMPLLSPYAATPNDPYYVGGSEWNMSIIHAECAWDISTGDPAVIICIFDSGCELGHPDLTIIAGGGINAGTLGDGSPVTTGGIGAVGLGFHGTACAGVAAAIYNNALGVVGVAGRCTIMPVAFENGTDAELIYGIGYAVANGAKVISMSFGNGYQTYDLTVSAWNLVNIDVAINDAFVNHNVFMCAATHNQNMLDAITYPAVNPQVMACGASDRNDLRLSGISNYGIAMSVVAPGDDLPTTDLLGTAGLNAAASPDGDYYGSFHYTSAATPHVAGLAALLFSKYPGLTNKQVFDIIERTAEKVRTDTYTYATTPPQTVGAPGSAILYLHDHHNGAWNQEMGYGRIHACNALDFGDVMIRDYQVDASTGLPDAGAEPSTPLSGDFWDFSDIVVRTFDDNVFHPGDPAQSNQVERKNDNFVYIRVFNNGPATARNVIVDATITPFVGTQFAYTDWTASDATHVHPAAITATLGNIASGGNKMAKFRISAAQTDVLWGWESMHPWHPCLLAKVTADNDYAFVNAVLTGDPLATRLNNLAQRNLTVVNLIAPFIRIVHFPFISGHRRNSQRFMELLIDRSSLPREARLRLSLDDDGQAFPLVDFHTGPHDGDEQRDDDLVFLERTRIETKLGCCRGILTLEKGSRFHCLRDDKIGQVSVAGGKVVVENGKRYVEVTQPLLVVRMEKQPGGIYPLALELTLPPGLKTGDTLSLRVSQRDENQQVVGGAGAVYRIS